MNFVLRLALATIYLVIATPIACGIFIALSLVGVASLLFAIIVGTIGVIGYGIYQIIRYQLKGFIKKVSF